MFSNQCSGAVCRDQAASIGYISPQKWWLVNVSVMWNGGGNGLTALLYIIAAPGNRYRTHHPAAAPRLVAAHVPPYDHTEHVMTRTAGKVWLGYSSSRPCESNGSGPLSQPDQQSTREPGPGCCPPSSLHALPDRCCSFCNKSAAGAAVTFKITSITYGILISTTRRTVGAGWL